MAARMRIREPQRGRLQMPSVLADILVNRVFADASAAQVGQMRAARSSSLNMLQQGARCDSMIRPSLKEAIKRTLDTHHYLGWSDFVIRDYEKDNEACVAIGYRERRVCSFIFQVKKKNGLFREPSYAITMSPGHETFEEALTVNDQPALLQELKGWQQRVHEDVGTMPRSRLFQAHIRGISRMEARLGLASKGLVGTQRRGRVSRRSAPLGSRVAGIHECITGFS
jgi:hypothetical protein